MKRKFKIYLIFSVKIGLTIFFVLVLFRYVEFHSVWTALQNVKLSYFLLAILVALVNGFWVGALRWKYLINFDVEGGMKTLCMLSVIGSGLNFIFPGNIVGEIVKGFNVSGKNVPAQPVIASIVMDKIVILTSLTILSFVGLILTRGLLIEAKLFLYPAVVVGLMVVSVGLIYSGILSQVVQKAFFLPRVIREKLKEFLQIFDIYRQKKRSVGKSILVALIATSLTSSIYYFISKGLDINIHYGIWFAFVPVVTVISRIPVTVGGLGLRDGALMFLLSSLSVPLALSMSISLLFFATTLIASLLGVGLYMVLQIYKFIEKIPKRHLDSEPVG